MELRESLLVFIRAYHWILFSSSWIHSTSFFLKIKLISSHPCQGLACGFFPVGFLILRYSLSHACYMSCFFLPDVNLVSFRFWTGSLKYCQGFTFRCVIWVALTDCETCHTWSNCGTLEYMWWPQCTALPEALCLTTVTELHVFIYVCNIV